MREYFFQESQIKSEKLYNGFARRVSAHGTLIEEIEARYEHIQGGPPSSRMILSLDEFILDNLHRLINYYSRGEEITERMKTLKGRTHNKERQRLRSRQRRILTVLGNIATQAGFDSTKEMIGSVVQDKMYRSREFKREK
jgi:hypothetical protein